MNKLLLSLLIFVRCETLAFAQNNATESPQEASQTGMVLRKSADAELSFDDKSCVNLKAGELLLFAQTKKTICAEQYRLVLSKGSIALVSVHSQVLKVRNMSEERHASLKVCINKKQIDLCAGEEIVIAPTEKSLHSEMSKDMLIRRQSNLFNLSSGGILVHSEFLPLSLIKRSPVLSQVAHCSNKQDKVLYGKILKMAACLGHTTSGHGNYSMLTE